MREEKKETMGDKLTADERKKKLVEKAKQNHPLGTCLLSRDNAHNRDLFPDGPFGEVDVAESICPSPDECPHYHYTEDQVSPGSEETPIHLLVASYRDRLCGRYVRLEEGIRYCVVTAVTPMTVLDSFISDGYSPFIFLLISRRIFHSTIFAISTKSTNLDCNLSRTLHNAFRHAKNPNRLYIRVIDQTKVNSDLEDDAGCFDHYCEKYNPNCQEYKDQVRIIPVDSEESLGPTWARSRLSAMVRETYNKCIHYLSFQRKIMQKFRCVFVLIEYTHHCLKITGKMPLFLKL